ncbi:MAG: hypothetical protein K1X79_03505 [Oligoflexia bacterium]|nr:hypothetical protein [Oligoflexia bacterium]
MTLISNRHVSSEVPSLAAVLFTTFACLAQERLPNASDALSPIGQELLGHARILQLDQRDQAWRDSAQSIHEALHTAHEHAEALRVLSVVRLPFFDSELATMLLAQQSIGSVRQTDPLLLSAVSKSGSQACIQAIFELTNSPLAGGQFEEYYAALKGIDPSWAVAMALSYFGTVAPTQLSVSTAALLGRDIGVVASDSAERARVVAHFWRFTRPTLERATFSEGATALLQQLTHELLRAPVAGPLEIRQLFLHGPESVQAVIASSALGKLLAKEDPSTHKFDGLQFLPPEALAIDPRAVALSNEQRQALAQMLSNRIAGSWDLSLGSPKMEGGDLDLALAFPALEIVADAVNASIHEALANRGVAREQASILANAMMGREVALLALSLFAVRFAEDQAQLGHPSVPLHKVHHRLTEIIQQLDEKRMLCVTRLDAAFQIEAPLAMDPLPAKCAVVSRVINPITGAFREELRVAGAKEGSAPIVRTGIIPPLFSELFAAQPRLLDVLGVSLAQRDDRFRAGGNGGLEDIVTLVTSVSSTCLALLNSAERRNAWHWDEIAFGLEVARARVIDSRYFRCQHTSEAGQAILAKADRDFAERMKAWQSGLGALLESTTKAHVTLGFDAALRPALMNLPDDLVDNAGGQAVVHISFGYYKQYKERMFERLNTEVAAARGILSHLSQFDYVSIDPAALEAISLTSVEVSVDGHSILAEYSLEFKGGARRTLRLTSRSDKAISRSDIPGRGLDPSLEMPDYFNMLASPQSSAIDNARKIARILPLAEADLNTRVLARFGYLSFPGPLIIHQAITSAVLDKLPPTASHTRLGLEGQMIAQFLGAYGLTAGDFVRSFRPLSEAQIKMQEESRHRRAAPSEAARALVEKLHNDCERERAKALQAALVPFQPLLQRRQEFSFGIGLTFSDFALTNIMVNLRAGDINLNVGAFGFSPIEINGLQISPRLIETLFNPNLLNYQGPTLPSSSLIK